MGALLRALFALVLGFLLARWLGRVLRRTGMLRGPRPRSGLDPGRAVRASWSEVKDEEKGGPKDL